ncbi:hypothetical protein [Listeria valentina]|uniref:hypothetical protein n=1 Tax=Listeria valentina TaxID=2705293 RepID=UPI001430D3A4|nr:hypothetical protein [Listeria valentina]
MYFLIKIRNQQAPKAKKTSFYVLNFQTKLDPDHACQAIFAWLENRKQAHQSVAVFKQAYRSLHLEHIEFISIRAISSRDKEKEHAFRLSQGKKLALKPKHYQEIEQWEGET